MAQLESLAGEFEKANAQVACIAAEKREGFHKPVQFLQQNPVSFPFLLDEDRTVTKAYGLYHRIGLDAINIAHPATLIIDRSGIVRYIYRGSNQFDRAPVEPFLEAARKLKD
ncbi:MAG TPA: redoxin domain-containing protein [Terriglobales bacterium]|nr:redoxin domain-containing protein [Terriglobales bacterium]